MKFESATAIATANMLLLLLLLLPLLLLRLITTLPPVPAALTGMHLNEDYGGRTISPLRLLLVASRCRCASSQAPDLEGGWVAYDLWV